MSLRIYWRIQLFVWLLLIGKDSVENWLIFWMNQNLLKIFEKLISIPDSLQFILLYWRSIFELHFRLNQWFLLIFHSLNCTLHMNYSKLTDFLGFLMRFAWESNLLYHLWHLASSTSLTWAAHCICSESTFHCSLRLQLLYSWFS